MTLAFSPETVELDPRHLIGGVRQADTVRLPVVSPVRRRHCNRDSNRRRGRR